MILSDR